MAAAEGQTSPKALDKKALDKKSLDERAWH
jgi:hypothetical protein